MDDCHYSPLKRNTNQQESIFFARVNGIPLQTTQGIVKDRCRFDKGYPVLIEI
jgi:hypothetical protein